MKKHTNSITVSADNSFYEPYEISFGDISEVWRYVRGILPQEYKPHHLPDEINLKNLVEEAKRSISNLENSILRLTQ